MSEPGAEQPAYTVSNDALLLRIKAFPLSQRNDFAGVRNDELIVRLKAAPRKGKANAELVKFLAKRLGVSRSEIRILSGETSRHKLVTLPLKVRAVLEEALRCP